MSEQRMRWYVVQAFSGFEGRVAKSLKEHIKMHGMEDLFGEVLVPTEEVVEMRAGQKRKSERKFFPGYILVKMELNDETWHIVKETSKVTGFVGGNTPFPIADEEINKIADCIIRVPAVRDVFSPITASVPLQLLAREVAILRGCDVDQPRNLAKSVTVE